MKSSGMALYVHIPFCKTICSYCDFCKFIYNQKFVDGYLKSLFFELSTYDGKKYKSIYIGGGTPSSLDNNSLNTLLNNLSNRLDDKYKEFTIEANVEDINETFLETLVKYKINRLSIGVQSFNDKYIKYCNRHHNKKMAIDAINLALRYINNVSIDLIYAFEGQTIKEIKEDIDIALSLKIKHISYYSLLVEKGTMLANKNVENVDDITQAKQYEYIYKRLTGNHFHRYEISNFARNIKYESYHNKIYWKAKHYDAVGGSASGYIGNTRYTNTKNLSKYIAGDYKKMMTETLTKKDLMFEMIMLNLRMDIGMDINMFNNKFHADFESLYKDAIDELLKYKLINISEGKIKTTYKGSLLLNDVLERFLD